MDSIKQLKDLFAKFPAVGPKMASRFVFYLIHSSKQEIDQLVQALQQLKNSIAFCSFCFQPFEKTGEQTLCPICSDPLRDKKVLCLVEKESDLISIENTKRYKGLYFILGNDMLSLRNISNETLRLDQLKSRMANSQFSEIIIATNPTPEGKTISLLVERTLKELPQFANVKITHLAKGLPVGGELEYADEETLESAFEGRK